MSDHEDLFALLDRAKKWDEASNQASLNRLLTGFADGCQAPVAVCVDLDTLTSAATSASTGADSSGAAFTATTCHLSLQQHVVRCTASQAGLVAAEAALKSFTDVCSLSVSVAAARIAAVPRLLGVLPSPHKLRRVQLTLPAAADAAAILSTLLPSVPALQVLQLVDGGDSPRWGDDVITALLPHAMPQLGALHLHTDAACSWNPVHYASNKLLARLLEALPRLTDLRLRGVPLTLAAARVLPRRLQRLHLCDAVHDEAGAQALAAALAAGKPKLRWLDLSCNTTTTGQFVLASVLAPVVMRRLPQLLALVLQQCKLQDLALVSACLAACAGSLQHLDVRCNAALLTGDLARLGVLHQLTQLRRLFLGYPVPSAEHEVSVSKALSRLLQLQHLTLPRTPTGIRFFLLHTLPRLDQLTHLVLHKPLDAGVVVTSLVAQLPSLRQLQRLSVDTMGQERDLLTGLAKGCVAAKPMLRFLHIGIVGATEQQLDQQPDLLASVMIALANDMISRAAAPVLTELEVTGPGITAKATSALMLALYQRGGTVTRFMLHHTDTRVPLLPGLVRHCAFRVHVLPQPVCRIAHAFGPLDMQLNLPPLRVSSLFESAATVLVQALITPPSLRVRVLPPLSKLAASQAAVYARLVPTGRELQHILTASGAVPNDLHVAELLQRLLPCLLCHVLVDEPRVVFASIEASTDDPSSLRLVQATMCSSCLHFRWLRPQVVPWYRAANEPETDEDEHADP